MKFKGITLALVFSFIGLSQLFAQDSTQTDECAKWRGLYYQYLKQKMYRDAGTMWGNAVKACGEAGLDGKFFNNGRVIYSQLMKEHKEDAAIIAGLNDTMIFIYEGKRKLEKDPEWDLDYAVFLMSIDKEDIAQLDDLFKAVHELKEKTKSTALKQYFIHLILNKFNKAPQEEKEEIRVFVIEEYIHLSHYCDQAIKIAKETNDEKDIQRYEGAQQFLDKYFLKIASDCDVLTGVLERKLATLPEEKEARKYKVQEFLELMDRKKCTSTETYGKYVDELISIEPTAEAYYFGARNQEDNGNTSKAVEYYQKAVEAETESGENFQKYQFAYANALYKAGSYKSAFSQAKKVSGDDYGKAMEICAGCIVKLANSCGESTFERKANYWLANDYIQKAGGGSRYLDSAPTDEEIFNEGVQKGSSFTLSCWGESTIVR